MAVSTATKPRTLNLPPHARVIQAQPGPQTDALRSRADILIYGGAAGGGKSFALLLEAARHTTIRNFSAVIFRRTSPEIRNAGGLWDESQDLYRSIGGVPYETTLEWKFGSGAGIKFSHLQYEHDKYGWQGSQVPLIGFDELTHFSETQFFYLLTRSRSTCGVKPYMRATTNPNADSWVAKLIAWWIDQDTGFPISERAGVLRYFVRINEQIEWGDSREELVARFPEFALEHVKSLTFIPATIEDNKILLEKDPAYLGNLLAQPFVERERLLKGNWKVRPAAGKVFNRSWFPVVDVAPGSRTMVRFWDLAATEKKMGKADPDYTSSVKMSRADDGCFYIHDVTNEQLGPVQGDSLIKNLASQDGRFTHIRWEEEGGASGKRDSLHLVQMLAGYDARGRRPRGDKIVRAKGLAAQAEAGNVRLVRADWNDPFLTQLHAQPEWNHDDMMDAAAGAFNELTSIIEWTIV